MSSGVSLPAASFSSLPTYLSLSSFVSSLSIAMDGGEMTLLYRSKNDSQMGGWMGD